MKLERNIHIDVCKGIGVLLVLLGHSFVGNIYNTSIICKTFRDTIYSFHMPLFFALAGFVYTQGKFDVRYIKNKFNRLMGPYFMNRIVCEFIKNRMFSISLVKGFAKDLFLLGYNCWFPYTMFFLYMIFPLIEKLLKKLYISIILILLLIISTKYIRVPYFSLVSVIMFLPYFIIGYILKKMNQQEILISNYWNKLFVEQSFIKTFFVIVVFVSLNVFDISKNNAFLEFITALGGIYLTYCVSVQIVKMKNERLKNIISEIGKNSLTYYLLPSYFIYDFINRLVVNTLNIKQPFLIIISVFFMQLLIISLVIKCIKKNKVVCYILGKNYRIK